MSYLYGYGVDEDNAQAIQWLRQGAAQEDDIAQYYLGVCYKNGYGVERSVSAALNLFRKAAEQGNDDAQYEMGEFRGERE